MNLRLWSAYFLDFIFSGLVRAFLPNGFSNALFFLRAFLIFALILILLRSRRVLNAFSRYFVLLSFVLFGFQFILYTNGRFNAVSFFYGIYLYVVPLLGIVLAENIDWHRVYFNFYLILKFALPANLLVAILQTVFAYAPLYSAGFGTGLYSSDGVQRATGTFSSAVGLSLFTTVSIVILFGVQILSMQEIPRYIWLNVLFLIILSGSRTTYFNIGMLFMIAVFNRTIRRYLFSNFQIIRLISLTGIFFLLTLPYFAHVYISSIQRFRSANKINPPFYRLFQQLSWDGYGSNAFGDGLGTHALGTVSNSDRRVLYSNWIEFDNARILVEAGAVFFVLIWISKFLFLVYVSQNSRISSIENKAVIYVNMAALIPYIFFGQIFGQGSIGSGVFLLMYLTLAISRSG